LDGDIKSDQAGALREHLRNCRSCSDRLRQLEHAEALVRHMPTIEAPLELSERIMRAIPRNRAGRTLFGWVKKHPAAVAAAAFAVIMLVSYMSLWDKGTELVVKGGDLDQVEIRDDTVIVPAGHTVHGNLFVENGKIQVDGDVDGNLVVVDGQMYKASTANIAGDVTNINRALDWIWYRVNRFFAVLADY
ncbi:MAG TPA: polymer-forming cytoskeletal protein, partial [Bacilli bacterium]